MMRIVGDRTEIGTLLGCVGIIHVIGWGMFLLYVPLFPAMAGMGMLAYGLGLRHAFDVDHIAAIDDTARFLLQKRKNPLSVGFFFSLGHSSIVLLMTIAVATAAQHVRHVMPQLETYGGVVGPLLCGIFLWFVGLLNLPVLLEMLHLKRMARSRAYQDEDLDQLLAQRGLMRRILGNRLQNLINHSWQTFPVGLLFGLSFDTASEIGLLALAAGLSAHTVPVFASVSLALLFAAGMCMMDTADGIFMVKAYSWAFSSPLRKISYNLTTTSLSVAVALLVGTIELLRVALSELKLRGRFADGLVTLDFTSLGYAIVALFVLGWACSVFIWKIRGMGEA
jgi:nickel/cobalt transporter (NiCoT) family protein